MKHNRNPLATAIHYALGAGMVAGLAMTAAPVIAQDDDEEAADLDRLAVTGTRILSPIVTSSAPITEIGEEEVQFSGTTRIEDLVGQYPQAFASSDSFTVNPTAGFPSVSLRGMGTNRTLTLVNGHRLPPGGIRSEARDLNQIPAALVKRVEILTGGASAVYGSDAMAGVVNFILDTDYTGMSIQAGYSGYQHDNSNSYIQGLMDNAGFDYPSGNSGLDGRSKFIDLTVGSFFADGRGHAMGWVTYRDNESMLQGERDYSSCALNAGGTACGGSATAPKAQFQIVDANLTLAPVGFAANLGPNGVWRTGFDDIYNFAPINHYQRPDKRWTFGSSIKYEVNRHVRPYVETMFANTNGSAQIAESGTFAVNRLQFNCTDELIGTMCADLGLNAAEPIAVYVLKRNVEGGPRIANIEASNFRIVTGVEGDITDNWSYNVSYLHARNASTESNENDFIPSRLGEALLLCPPGSAASCQPYNVWTPDAVVTPEQALAQGGTGIRQGANQLQVFNAYATGDIGFGFASADNIPISLVAGGEWRREIFQVISDANMATGNFAGLGGPRPSIAGEIKVNELFVESAVPILANRGAIDSLALDLGYRLSDYSTSGTVHTWKVGFAAQIFNDYRIRGGFNRAIRAANTGELFAQQQIALWPGNDPCAGANPEFTQAQCLNTGVSAAQYGVIPASPANQYNQFVGGNPNLDPEEADTWTLGFVATPIDGLQVAIDYWSIEMTDRIGTIGANTILRFCGLTGDPTLCNSVRRNPATGDLWLGSDPNNSGLIFNQTSNFGDFTFRGIDLNASYRWNMFGGMMMTSIAGSYFLEQEVAPLPGVNDAATFDCAGRINSSCQTPNWRHIATTRYMRDNWTLSARWRMIGRMNYRETSGALGTADQILVRNGNRIGSYHFYDLSGSYRFLENYEVTLGVNNVFDKEPPMVGSTLNLNANSIGGYDQLGRYIYGTVRVDF